MRSKARSAAREIVSLSCGGGSCPGIFQAPDGAYLVQGYSTSALGRLLRRERIVEVPAELMTLAFGTGNSARQA